jgi:predicted nuclease of predicted toxin-antitoxin system
MTFLLDENFPKAAGAMLAGRSHEILDFRGSVDEGMPDTEVFKMAQAATAVLLATDRDFFHTIDRELLLQGIAFSGWPRPDRHWAARRSGVRGCDPLH